MHIKAIHSIRHSGRRWAPGQVLEIDDVRAQRLIVQGYAQEAAYRDKPSEGTPVTQEPTETLVEEVVAGGGKKGKRR